MVPEKHYLPDSRKNFIFFLTNVNSIKVSFSLRESQVTVYLHALKTNNIQAKGRRKSKNSLAYYV
jgi:hypothetical protein